MSKRKVIQTRAGAEFWRHDKLKCGHEVLRTSSEQVPKAAKHRECQQCEQAKRAEENKQLLQQTECCHCGSPYDLEPTPTGEGKRCKDQKACQEREKFIADATS